VNKHSIPLTAQDVELLKKMIKEGCLHVPCYVCPLPCCPIGFEGVSIVELADRMLKQIDDDIEKEILGESK